MAAEEWVLYDGRYMPPSQAKALFNAAVRSQAEWDKIRKEAENAAEEQKERDQRNMERIARKPVRKHLSLEQMADILTDHEYIAWKFDCATKPSPRWLAPL